MQKYQRSNERAIKSGFRELDAMKDIICANTLCEVLNMAMQRVLEGHDLTHFGHRITSDSLAWMVFHDGKEYQSNTNIGHHGTGDALNLIREVGSGRASTGWVGILLASMIVDINGRKPLFLEIEFEQDLLNATANWTDKEIFKHFKRISQ